MAKHWYGLALLLDIPGELVGAARNYQVNVLGVELQQIVQLVVCTQQSDRLTLHILLERLQHQLEERGIRIGRFRATFEEQSVAGADSERANLGGERQG